MNKLYVYARKCRDGSVDILKPNPKPLKPAIHWLNIKRDNSERPDYRNKYITLNCYRYPIFWCK